MGRPCSTGLEDMALGLVESARNEYRGLIDDSASGPGSSSPAPRRHGHGRLMAHAPVVGRSIHERNPMTDMLPLTQIDLLERFGRDHKAQRTTIAPVTEASINAIAGAMRPRLSDSHTVRMRPTPFGARGA